MDTNAALTDLMISLEAAGRKSDAAKVAQVIKLNKEVGEWVACLRCGMAFPTSEAKSQHYNKAHGVREFWGR